MTAERRSERNQDVPISVAAITASQLQSSGVNALTDLRVSVPSLNSVPTAGYYTPRIRGIGSAALGPGIENSVATYVDGVYYASAQSALMALNSIDHIEVLKGPQGTLFGRNATGGLIQVFTADPKQQFGAKFDASYANYNTATANAYVTGGVTSDVAADLAVHYSHQGEGWGRNEFSGQDVDRQDHDFAIRSKWLLSPFDSTRITFIADYGNKDGSTLVYRVLPGTQAVYDPGRISHLPGWDANTNTEPRLAGWNSGASLKWEQDFADLTFSEITAFRRSRYGFQFDLDFTAVNAQAIYPTEWDRQFSQEVQLQPKSPGPLKWIVGAYYFDAAGGYDPNNVELIQFGLTSASHSTQTTRSTAGYAQASYEFLPRTNLTLGGRYTTEKRNLVGESDLLAYGTTFQVAPALLVDKDVTFDKFTFRAALDHKPTDNLMLFASFNRGFKSGGFNAGTIQDPPFRPELLDAYEGGFKSEFFNRHLRINGSGFYYHSSDIQVQIVRLGAIGILNGASAKTYGGDLDIDAALTDKLTVSVGVEHLDPRFTSFPSAVLSSAQGGVPITYGPADGKMLPVASKYVGNTAINYSTSLGLGTLNLNSTFYYNSGWFAEPDNVIRQGGFLQINARAQWESANGLSISFWGQNLGDRRVMSYASTVPEGTHSVLWAPPRTYGVTLGMKF